MPPRKQSPKAHTPHFVWTVSDSDRIGVIGSMPGAEQPRGQIWVLPDDRLVQLILGLSTLVQSTTLVSGHNFGSHGRRAW